MKDRETFVLINIDNYINNLKYIEKITNSKVIPVLKANAYGHGKEILAKELKKEGYDLIAVAYLSEALEILKETKIQTLIFNYFNPQDLKELIEFSDYILPTITSVDFLKEAVEILKEDITKFKFHINYNTGMFRVGLSKNELKELITIIKENNIQIDGFYSHYATADDMDEFVHFQHKKYLEVLDILKEENISIRLKHMSNSAASLLFPEYSLDAVRPGIASYGMQPSNKKIIKELKPVLSFKSVIAKLNELNIGDTVGYGRTFKADKKMIAGIVPVGYADGYFRNLSNKAEMLVNGIRCKIIGRVSMDQIIIDVTNAKAKIGDEVVLIGKQKNEEITSEELANLSNTINYEITSKITNRVKRVYFRGGKYFE
ncbi:alanine racemase [Tepiditoga spiralis]|uniref:Alanine racemase n=1 Tax=Tepiditoga spiralis TaxID=2108365 RepID=A0A7G1G3M6_9BACT|nr:alanine racemase [Tepiditoga spiralis]BBE31030.1 alanine racemase [Tepiditoga spiralis]